MTIDSTWYVPRGTTSLCLDGHSITYCDDSQDGLPVITIYSNATLNLYDKAGDSGKITGGKDSG